MHVTCDMFTLANFVQALISKLQFTNARVTWRWEVATLIDNLADVFT